MVDSIVQDGINAAEFGIAFIEPPDGRRGKIDRPKRPEKFAAAHVVFNFSDGLTETEMDTAFQVAMALGTSILTAYCSVRSIKRPAPFADKHKIYLTAHSDRLRIILSLTRTRTRRSGARVKHLSSKCFN